MSKAKYNLYVVRPEDISDDEKRYLITPDYCLLYTSALPPNKHEIVTNLEELPAVAWEWLKEQIESIRMEHLIKHEHEILKKAKAFNDRFAQELAAESQELIASEGVTTWS